MAVDKLVDSSQLNLDLISIANAIRVKGGTSGQLVFPSGFVSAIRNIPTGGEPVSVEEKDVNFIDYDGTILYSYTKSEINAMESESELPPNPTHTGLTAQGWNWTLAQIKAQLTAVPDGQVWIGQMYVTTSGKTEINIVLDDPNYLSPYLTISPNGTVEVDWGDGSSPDTITGTNNNFSKYLNHTYATIGKYTIKLSVISGNFSFYTAGSSYDSVLRTAEAMTNRERNRIYCSTIKAIRIGNNARIANYAFNYCYELETITIPANVTSIGSYAFSSCFALKSITIPNGVTSINAYTFNNCCALKSIAIPSSVTSIGNYTFTYCYALKSVTIPNGVTTINPNTFGYCYALKSIAIPNGVTGINTYAFSNCYALKSVTIPNGVKSIGSSAFSNCYALKSIIIPDSMTSIGSYAFGYCYYIHELHFASTTPPTLESSSAIPNQSYTIIYVPYSADHSVLNAYKTANNWSSHATRIQEEPAA